MRYVPASAQPAFGGDCDDVCCSFDKIQFDCTRTSRLTAIYGDSTQDLDVCGNDGRRPTSLQFAAQYQLTVIRPRQSEWHGSYGFRTGTSVSVKSLALRETNRKIVVKCGHRKAIDGRRQNLISTIMSDSWLAGTYFLFLTAFNADSARSG